MKYQKNLIYNNSLSCEKDIEDFVSEGSPSIYFDNKKMYMTNAIDASIKEKSNFVFWCPINFPDNIIIEWEFRPVIEPGLAIMFFGARGIHGEDIFDKKLNPRDGRYEQYHSGDINAFHISYFRRKWDKERRFHTCNLRKSKGFYLVSQGADPIPDVDDCQGPYKLKISKIDNNIDFYIDNLHIFNFCDNEHTYGTHIGGGKIGFRQMAPLKAEYSNLKVYEVIK